MATKKIVLLFIGFFLFQNLFSQEEVTTKVGKTFDIPKGYSYMELLGDEKNGFAQLSIKSNQDIIIQEIDSKSLIPTTEKKYDLSSFPKNLQSDLFKRTIDGNYFWFYSYRTKDKIELHYDLFDIKNKSFGGKNNTLIICDKTNEEFYYDKPTTKRYDDAYVRFNYLDSRDKSKLLIRCDFAVKGNRKKGFYVFDKEMNPLWKQEFEFPYTFEEMDTIDYFVDNDGNVYCLIRVYDKKLKDSEAEKNCWYELYKFSNTSQKPVVLTIKTENKYYQSLKISCDNSNNIVVCGYYTDNYNNENTKSLMRGGFYTETLKNELVKGFVVITSTKNMSQSDLKITDYKIPEECNLNSSGNELNNIYTKDVLFTDDNSIFVVGEKVYSGFYREYGYNGAVSIVTTRTACQIIVSKISADKKLEWSKIIPKGQFGGGFYLKREVSYHLVSRKDGLYFFYKMHPNLEKSLNFNYGNSGNNYVYKKQCLNYVKVLFNGDVSSNKELEDLKEISKYHLSEVADNELLIQGGRRNDKESIVRLIKIN